ncbi:ankyrin repeat domain-containing protein [Streptomyces sp. NPDC018693]|uniref:ankyrin repeat domain-containing protein n=1 Tax=unclassified Streptomyces TaxID=2593676 RepID=UPI0037AAD678
MSEVMSESLFAAVMPVRGGDPTERAALVRSLIADGAQVSARDEQRATPLHRAVEAPYDGNSALPSLEVVRALLECGADVHAVDNHGATPVGRAVAYCGSGLTRREERALEVLELLVEHGARLDGPSGLRTGGSLAHHSDVARQVYAFLLDHGAPIDAVDHHGDTPLHAAVRSRRPDLVKLLLGRGADSAAVNGLGQTPLGVALRLPDHGGEKREAQAETVAVLEAAGAPARVRHPVVEGGPLPIDMEAIRRVAGVLRAEQAAVYEAAGLPDGSGWLTELVEPDLDTYQEFAARLREGIDPDLLGAVPEMCAKALGGDGATRTLLGDQLLNTPFFHHGDLVVKGHLQVAAPFVLTGSLTVEGVLRDCGPQSIMAIGGDVTARGMFTDGDVECRDIHAEVVYGSYNDHTLRAGTIHARLVIEDDHETIASVEADHYYDQDTYQDVFGEGVQEELRELLVDEVFAAEEDEDEERLDPGLLFDRLAEGLPVFRASATSQTR